MFLIKDGTEVVICGCGYRGKWFVKNIRNLR